MHYNAVAIIFVALSTALARLVLSAKASARTVSAWTKPNRLVVVEALRHLLIHRPAVPVPRKCAQNMEAFKLSPRLQSSDHDQSHQRQNVQMWW